jgi:membrane protease YdiL (CAAX protease family)
MSPTLPVAPVLYSVTVLLYYYWIAPKASFLLVRRISSILPFREIYPLGVIEDVVRMNVATVGQLIFCSVLVVIAGYSMLDIGLGTLRGDRVILGAVLGIGEMGLGSFLGFVAISVRAGVTGLDLSSARRRSLINLSGGWVGEILRTLNVVPLPFGLLIVFFYVAGEEIVFRSVLITQLMRYGPSVCIVGSTALFAIVQKFGMPTWHAALFPAIGAVVVGIVHGSLFVAIPDITPLIIAHFVLVVATIL